MEAVEKVGKVEGASIGVDLSACHVLRIHVSRSQVHEKSHHVPVTLTVVWSCLCRSLCCRSCLFCGFRVVTPSRPDCVGELVDVNVLQLAI